jgi:hypothetical protein
MIMNRSLKDCLYLANKQARLNDKKGEKIIFELKVGSQIFSLNI